METVYTIYGLSQSNNYNLGLITPSSHYEDDRERCSGGMFVEVRVIVG